MTNTTNQVAELRAKITRLTGKEPKSEDAEYLTQRLKALQEKKASGIDVRRETGTAPITASMPVKARRAVDRIIAKEKVTTSAFVLRALRFWAEQNGYEDEAAAMGVG